VNFFYRLTWDRFASEDYSQEVFARLIRYRASYRPTAKFTTYLFRIAKNYWIDQYRSKVASPDMMSLEKPIREQEGRTLSLRDTVESADPGPERRLHSRDIGRRVKEAIGQLPEEQRLVFVMSENQGLKYADIAEVLEIPVGTVKSRMHAAVRRLREMLRDIHEQA
jgi:RNA polymerase sigma-70 factor (ECF subfamily)